MQLVSVTVDRFHNFVSPQTVPIEADVTCLVGKNESGKTSLLRALHRLRPANGSGEELLFNLTLDYPRWRLARDRRGDPALADSVNPISAKYRLDEGDRAALAEHLGFTPPDGTSVVASKSYSNKTTMLLRADVNTAVRALAAETSVHDEDLKTLDTSSYAQLLESIKERAKALKDEEALRSKALTSLANALSKQSVLFGGSSLTQEAVNALWSRVPKTFYFSSYDLLPGECDLTGLAEKIATGSPLSSHESTAVALLRHAGEQPKDFLEDDYDSRKAELQAASSDLTRHVFQYWRQNSDLEVIFDDDNVVVGRDAANQPILHRLLKIEIRDGRHGGVETNFATRSTGFQWFFSFFAAFSEFQGKTDPVIVLLDEPGTSLHGDAQADFVRYVFSELGPAAQTMYTTHSQHMVDPTKYEKLRAVHDRATREDPDLGVSVSTVSLSADRDTLLPVESALGYSVSQHLFLGSGHHLAVEGSSDFVYLMRLSEHLRASGAIGLDPRFSIIPVGGIDNMPAFVALMGRRLKVTALIDGASTSGKADRVRAAARDNGMDESVVVTCGVRGDSLPVNADIEDLFSVADYLTLVNWAFGTAIVEADLPATTEPILKKLTSIRPDFDHALPAHALTEHLDEFLGGVSPTTVANFVSLFERLNATVE